MGVTDDEAADALDAPTAFTAVIVKVYAWSRANEPVTVRGLDVPETEREIEGLDATVYEVIGSLPVSDGGVNDSDTVVAFTTVGVTAVAAPGIVRVADAREPIMFPMSLFYLAKWKMIRLVS